MRTAQTHRIIRAAPWQGRISTVNRFSGEEWRVIDSRSANAPRSCSVTPPRKAFATKRLSMLSAVPVTPRIVGTEIVQTVSARDLHRALGIRTGLGGRKSFKDWASEHLVPMFVATLDYEIVPAEGLRQLDYALKLQCASELALTPLTAFSATVRGYLQTFMES